MARRAVELPPLEVVSREEFIRWRWKHENGNHVTAIGPTRCGKTHALFDALRVTISPELPLVMLVKKRRDALISKRIGELNLRRIESWPPSVVDRLRKPNGYVLWPKTDPHDVDASNRNKREQFRKAMAESYAKGDRILFTDDAYGVANILRLHKELTEYWTEASSIGLGIWAAFQRAAGVPLWAYSQAEHLFLFNEPDERGRERFGEIGGNIDPKVIETAVAGLQKYQCLYVRRDGKLCIIDRN
jgi:hypothetical protein